MDATSRTYGLAEFYRLRDEDEDPHNRYELIDGTLIVTQTAGPPHQRLLGRVSSAVGEIVERYERASQFYGPIDLRDGDRSVVQPDLLVLIGERAAFETARDVAGPPNLVVEVLSNWTEEIDRGEKPAFYARFGVDELWLVDGERRTLWVCSDPVDGRYRSVVTFATPGPARSATIPGLEVDLDELFAVPPWLVTDEAAQADWSRRETCAWPWPNPMAARAPEFVVE